MPTSLNPDAFQAIFKSLDALIDSCDIDYTLLKSQTIDANWLTDYNNQRIVNSFLFNYIKIQDKLGANLFRKLLFNLREINDEHLPMIDILNLLEKLNIIPSVALWDKLREIRNIITHEYPLEIEERLENIALTLSGYQALKDLYSNIKQYVICK